MAFKYIYLTVDASLLFHVLKCHRKINFLFNIIYLLRVIPCLGYSTFPRIFLNKTEIQAGLINIRHYLSMLFDNIPSANPFSMKSQTKLVKQITIYSFKGRNGK